MLKKVFIISSIFLVVVLIFLGVYNFIFRKNVDSPDQIGSSAEESSFFFRNASGLMGGKKEDAGKLILVSEDALVAPVISNDQKKILYFSASNGNLYEMGLKGEDRRALAQDRLVGMEDVQWSPQKEQVIYSLPENGGRRFFVYDYNQEKHFQLKEGIDSVAWVDFGQKIIYKHFDSQTGKRTINISGIDGADSKTLAETEYRDVGIWKIPGSLNVAFWNSPKSSQESFLKTAGINGEGENVFFSGKFGVDYLWSPDGSNILLAHSGDQTGKSMTLALIDRKGLQYRSLSIPTFISKAVWSQDNKTIYYALPTALPKDAVLPDDYVSRKVTTADTFWKVDISTGRKERVVSLENMTEIIDAENMILSPEEESLFFTDRSTGNLYKINIR